MLIKKSVTSARIERCRTTMNGTDDPRPLTERIRQIAVGLPLGKCHRQEAMCNHEGCRLKNLEALVAEVGELERDIHRNKAYVAEHVRCFLERAEAAENLLAEAPNDIGWTDAFLERYRLWLPPPPAPVGKTKASSPAPGGRGCTSWGFLLS